MPALLAALETDQATIILVLVAIVLLAIALWRR